MNDPAPQLTVGITTRNRSESLRRCVDSLRHIDHLAPEILIFDDASEVPVAETLKSHPEQHSRVEFEEFRTALSKLPPDQREALILVGASGFSYEEAAAICECAVGTIKSRVNRARTRLSELLSIDGADDFGPDHTTRAILSAGGRG